MVKVDQMGFQRQSFLAYHLHLAWQTLNFSVASIPKGMRKCHFRMVTFVVVLQTDHHFEGAYNSLCRDQNRTLDHICNIPQRVCEAYFCHSNHTKCLNFLHVWYQVSQHDELIYGHLDNNLISLLSFFQLIIELFAFTLFAFRATAILLIPSSTFKLLLPYLTASII